MKSMKPVVGLLAGLFCLAIAAESQASPPASEWISKANQPPRKVVVGTSSMSFFVPYPGLEERLKILSGHVDEMASQAATKYPGKGLDLAILTEDAVTSQRGPALERAVPLEGIVRQTFSALARKHHTYIVAGMDLAEEGPKGKFASNAAVLFDRNGDVVGIYRKLHPVAALGTGKLEGGITPGTEIPVFDCDFGKLGIQICFDVSFSDGWEALAKKGAEIVAWPTQSPATVQTAARAVTHGYYIVSSTWRDNATVFEPTGFIGAQAEETNKILVHQLDLSYAMLGWAPSLRDGKGLSDKFGDRVGYHYGHSEDVGLFWSNDPKMTIGEMIRSLGLEEFDAELQRSRQLQDDTRDGPVP
jgi:beta-ureidopropionase